MTTLLTFLGTGRYETVTYTWEGKAAQPTHLFPLAADALFAPEKVVVFLTSQARQHENFRDLQSRLREKLQPVSIPEGRSQDELWEIFGQVANAVKDGETVILDITHAFRSIPLIVFNVAAYLRRTKNVTIEHILYGAFEAREPFRMPPQPEDRVPVFDLAPLLELLDWTSGAEALLKRGDAGLIAEKMIQT
ncbi:MAG: TIGR02221 family CRISPR-associated protein, partial [Armatimonadota bacterium]|nr:TIGR02221 family CRISPR-associated protein [Armatimonadota bacterium]